MRVAIGIDPGSGKSSPTGFAAIDPDTKTLIFKQNVRMDCDDFAHRIKGISSEVADLVSSVDPDIEVNVYIESFVMRGKGGEMLARLTGALMACIPYERQIAFVHNTTMKKDIAGHGRAEKEEVANALFIWAEGNSETQEEITNLTIAREWDILDAIGLAVAGDRKRQESLCNCSEA